MTRKPITGNLPPNNNTLELLGSSYDDRVLAAETYSRALEFINLASLGLVDQRPSQVIKNAAHAVQFVLKAVLLNSGHAGDWIDSHIGRDLEGAMALASSCGMPPPTPDFAGLLPELSRYHMVDRNFGQARVLSVMNSRRIFENVVFLVESVCKTLKLKADDQADV